MAETMVITIASNSVGEHDTQARVLFATEGRDATTVAAFADDLAATAATPGQSARSAST